MVPSKISDQATLLSPNNEGDEEKEEFIFHGPNSPPLRDINVAQYLSEQKTQHPYKAAVTSRWQNITRTYETLHSSTQEIAKSLLCHGVRPGDRVIVLAGNSVEYVELFLAIGSIGAIFAIINPTFTADEVEATVEFLDPKAVFIAERIGYRNNKGLLEGLVAKQDPSKPRSIIVWPSRSEQTNGNILTWSQFCLNKPDGAEDLIEKYWAKADPQDALCIQFTSGTTGLRKAGILTHRNLLNNAYLLGNRLDFSSDDILCCCPPLSHCFGLVCGVLASISCGSTVILPSDVFNAEASLRTIDEHHCTVIHAVPTMFQALLDYKQVKGATGEFKLRTGIIAGSSLSEVLLQRLRDELGLDGLAYAFGMTELSAVSFMTNPVNTSLLDDRSSVGTLLPHTSAKTVDSELNTLPAGDRGELLVAGYLVFQGYYGSPEKTKEAIVVDSSGRRWLRTGDIVTLSESGACTVVGRSKDMIKRGGENIFPSHVEQVLGRHPGILTTAVVGIPDARWGETVGAFIERQPGSEVSNRDVRLWLRSRLAAHQIPEHILWIGDGGGVPDRVPVNASGKVMKTELRRIADDLLLKD